MTTTKGPWFRNERTIYALNEKGTNSMCAQLHPSHIPGYDDEETQINNARLMAAAPDLLDSIKNLLGMFDNPAVRQTLGPTWQEDWHGEACRLAKEAINRVEGGGNKMTLPNLEFVASGFVVKHGGGKVHAIYKLDHEANWYTLECGEIAMIRPDQNWVLSDKPVTCGHCLKQLAKNK